jgi:hypothetical protein
MWVQVQVQVQVKVQVQVQVQAVVQERHNHAAARCLQHELPRARRHSAWLGGI